MLIWFVVYGFPINSSIFLLCCNPLLSLHSSHLYYYYYTTINFITTTETVLLVCTFKIADEEKESGRCGEDAERISRKHYAINWMQLHNSLFDALLLLRGNELDWGRQRGGRSRAWPDSDLKEQVFLEFLLHVTWCNALYVGTSTPSS